MELAAFNIQVNAVAPCMVKTDFSKPFWLNPAIHDQIVKTIPMGRIPEPVEIAHPTLFSVPKGQFHNRSHPARRWRGLCRLTDKKN